MLKSLIATLISGEASRAVGDARRAVLVYGFAGLATLVGAGFVIGACYVAAATRFGTIEAALGFGAVFVLLALVAVAVHLIIARRRKRREANRRAVDMSMLAGAAAVTLLPSLLKGKAGLGGIIGPALAVLAYAIYKENTKPPPDEDDLQE